MGKQVVQVCIVVLLIAAPSHALRRNPSCCNACDGVEVLACEGAPCACRSCPTSLGVPDFSNCSESIEGCAGSLKRVRGWSVMENNAVYRMADLLHHSGQKWRSDSIAIMCDPKFRSTLLRSVLVQTSTPNNSSIHFRSLSDGDLEKYIKAHSEGKSDFACVRGERGPNNLQLAPSSVQMNALGELTVERYNQGFCDQALDTDLVVSLRLGDFHPKDEELVRSVESSLASNSNIKRLVFSGVLHYGGYKGYIASAESIESNVQLVEGVMKHFREKGYDVMPRSEPVADKDLCFMASAKHLAIGGKGFADMVLQVREHFMPSGMMSYSNSSLSTWTPGTTWTTWIDPGLDGEP